MLAFPCSAAVIAKFTLAKSDARLDSSVSNAPPRMRDSTTRRLTFLKSSRAQKSKRFLKGPLLSRDSKMSSIAAKPVPLIAPSPYKICVVFVGINSKPLG